MALEDPVAPGPREGRPLRAEGSSSSTREFQAPQAEQRPIQVVWAWPHCWQT